MNTSIPSRRVQCWLAAATASALLACGTAQAQLSGPVYPAPGGTSFSSNGISFRAASSTPRIGTYSGFDPSAYGQLYFGETNNTSIGVSMDAGNSVTGAEWMRATSIFGNTVQLQGTTGLFNSANSQSYIVHTVMNLSLYDASNTPINFVTGLSVGLPDVDFLADVTTASGSGGFHYSATLQANACQGYTCSPFDSAANIFSAYHADGNGTLLQTSVSTGFYFTTPVPEPESYAMMVAGLGLVGYIARRRTQGRQPQALAAQT